MEGYGSGEPWMEFDCNGIVVAGLKMTLLIVTESVEIFSDEWKIE